MKLTFLISKAKRAFSSGFTLMEAIIVLAMLALAMATVFYGFNASMDVFNSEIGEADASLQANKAMERMTKELKGALSITTPSVRYITFWYRDLDADGTSDANELVTFTWDATGKFLNRTQSTTTVAVAKGIEYFALTYDVTADIDYIRIWITAKKNTSLTTLDSSVRPRNL